MKKPLFQSLRRSIIPAALLFAFTASFFSACKKEEKKDEYKVKFTVNCNGRFKGTPAITYNNPSGTSVTENLTVNKEWVKEISGSSSYAIKANVTGTFDSGEVILSSEAFKNGSLVDIGESSQSSPVEQSISVSHESTFE